MLGITLLVVACGSFSSAQEGLITVPPDNKTECIKQMQEWCDSMQYPQQGVGMAILSLGYEDPNGYYRVFCSSDSDGTNCTRNREPWFTCSPDHALTYKSKILTNSTSTEDVDGDICKTADKAFNDLFIQNLSYENTTIKNELQKGMEAFFQQMAAMGEEIAFVQRMLRRVISFSGIGGDVFRDHNHDFPVQETPSSVVDSVTSSPVVNNTEDVMSNVIETE